MPHTGKPAFIHKGSWDHETRANPAMKWIEDFTRNFFDTKDWTKCAQDSTPDFVYHKSNGSIFKGSEAAWKQIDQDYAPFAQHKHDPTFLLAWETSQGWEMMGEVNFFFNLPAPLPEIETDSEGKKWQGVGFGAYHFIYAKDGDGLKLKFTRIYSDPTPVMRLMLNSNLVSAEQVASMLRA